ncbi:Desumoylating isopeptidase 1 [Dictyocoela muelleri]|nr:Desumoylating isopeptidase 1 [Dictyocoela muelleri]
MNSSKTRVYLYVYDLSKGNAKKLSKQILGIQIDGIWHTSIVVFNQEYYYQRQIVSTSIGNHDYGAPVDIIEMGYTSVPQEIFHEYLDELSERFNKNSYDLMRNNCNHFSNEAVSFLLSKNIPAYILDLPEIVMETPMFQMFQSMFNNRKNL